MNIIENARIGIIGLGYVGLPLAIEFSKKYLTIGYDINISRVKEILDFKDSTNEISPNEIKEVLYNSKKNNQLGLKITNELDYLIECNYYIITVPTPIDKNKIPDLNPLISASKSVGKILKKGDIVVYESTVYPGATEEECVPILEKFSGLEFIKDFNVGYSPERINPGDKERTVSNIIKITSGSNNISAKLIDNLYKSIITAGTYLAPTIKVAEAAKVIENSQRDLNIAFVNELAKIFNILEIDTNDVLKAASTKWNFLNFKPGLVGGHCIGVDPYYLTKKALQVGYNPEIILAGRRLNDSMGIYVASQLIKFLLKTGREIKKSSVLILGITFKENCPDIRNTKVIDVINELNEFNVDLTIFDPWANKIEVKEKYDIDITNKMPTGKYDAILLAVSHESFRNIELTKYKAKGGFIYDLKDFVLGEVEYKL